jgi:MYXO-CTERM domain-containing protein
MRRFVLVGLMLSSTAAFADRVVVTPTRGDGLQFGRVLVEDPGTPAAARAQSRTVYLNKNGVSLTPGVNDARTNRSSIIPMAATVPAWAASPTLWSKTVTCLREMFAPFDVAITETDPGTLPHIEAVFGGSPMDLGMSGNLAGVSPFSSTCKVIENSIVFTFTDVIPQNAQVACEIMAQEIAHSYGLDHELLASDPMTYLSYTGKRTFQNQMASCGESSPRDCGIQGAQKCRDGQNSYAILMERIGAAGTGDIDAPTVVITSPTTGATVDQGFTITTTLTDDVGVKLAVLSIDGVSAGSLTAAPWSFTAPDLAPGKHVITVKATDGANEQIAEIEVTVRGEDGGDGDEEAPLYSCSTGGGTGWLLGLLLVGLVVIQRRAQR